MTGIPIADLWGSGQGPAVRLSPQGRMAVGFLLLAVVLVVDPATWAGILLWVAVLASWWFATRPPAPLVTRLLILGLVLLGPWFLLVPWIEPPTGGPRPEALWIEGAWAVAWRIFSRGLGGLLVGAWTATTLSLPDLGRGLIALPIPGALAMVLIQVVHQTHALVAETRGILQALRVRGATAGLRSVSAIAAALPRVWMGRILCRAERVGDAMEVRGFDSGSLGMDAAPWRRADVSGVGLAVVALCAAVTLRLVVS